MGTEKKEKGPTQAAVLSNVRSSEQWGMSCTKQLGRQAALA